MISLIKMKGVNLQTKEIIYYPKWTRFSTVTETQLAKRMARGSTFSVGEINGVFSDFPHSIIDELLDGNAVEIAGLGTFKLKVQGKSQKEKKDVTSAGAIISVVFEPAAELTSRLNDEKEFRFVEVPTKEGQKDTEEGGETPNTGNDNQGGQQTGGDDNQGSGQQTGGGIGNMTITRAQSADHQIGDSVESYSGGLTIQGTNMTGTWKAVNTSAETAATSVTATEVQFSGLAAGSYDITFNGTNVLSLTVVNDD